MTTVAVTGGIGCGKSTVTRLLAERGAAVVDADVVAREVVKPGSPLLGDLERAFGAEILQSDGTLDRAALARLAFASPAATARLNELLHPAIGVELVRQVDAARTAAKVVVVAIPLFRPEHRALLGLDAVVCVDCEPDTALRRLVGPRGMDADDAALRMAAQPSREERRFGADHVLHNDGTEADLERQVERLWDELVA